MTITNIHLDLIDAIESKKGLPYIQALVAQGANINYIKVEQGLPRSIINFAAESGDLELVKWLKSEGAKPFTYEFFGNHELYIEMTKALGEQAKITNTTLINSACNSGNIELVKWLLENNTDISEVVLSDATASQNLPLVKWLVEEKGVFIDDYTVTKAIPNREMVDWLFDHGAKIRDDGMDMCAAIRTGELELARLLYNKGAIIKDSFVELARRTGNQELAGWVKMKMSESIPDQVKTEGFEIVNTGMIQVGVLNISTDKHKLVGSMSVINDANLTIEKVIFENVDLKIGGTANFNFGEFYCTNSIIRATKVILSDRTIKYFNDCTILEVDDLLFKEFDFFDHKFEEVNIKPQHHINDGDCKVPDAEIPLLGTEACDYP